MKTAYIQLRVEEERKKKIEALAKKRGLTMTSFIMIVLNDRFPELWEQE